MTSLFLLMTVQGLLGGFDNLWHHEITLRLPAKRSAAPEIRLHALREFLYALLFGGLAWFQFHGAWAAVIVAILTLEVVVTCADFLVEDRTRRLPPLERIVHTLLAISFGVMLVLLGAVLARWWQEPTALVHVFHGAWTWLLSLFAVGCAIWSLRNVVASTRWLRAPEWQRVAVEPGNKGVPRHVLVTGATGFIGKALCRELLQAGDRIIVLTRDADRASELFGPHTQVVTSLDQIESGAAIDAVVNLAGAPIMGWPWTRRRREKLRGSRLATTRAVSRLVARLEAKPEVVVSASAVGYYGVRGSQRLIESSSSQPVFQSRLCRDWETEALAISQPGVRVCVLRIGLVLAWDGGALPAMTRAMKFRVNTVLGAGTQWVSWIHRYDLIRLIGFCIENQRVRGAVNATAPQPVTHAALMDAAARATGTCLRIRIPAYPLRLLLGEMAQLLLDGQRVVPGQALGAGFRFHHRTIDAALAVPDNSSARLIMSEG